VKVDSGVLFINLNPYPSMEIDKDFYLTNAWLCDPVTGEALQAVLTDLEEISQNDIQIRSQIDIDSINNIFDDVYVILDLDKQKNVESIPLENVAEEEVIRIILAETRNQKVQRAFQQAGDVSYVAHRKLSPQSSLAQEKANGRSITIIYVEGVVRCIAYMLDVYMYTYVYI